MSLPAVLTSSPLKKTAAGIARFSATTKPRIEEVRRQLREDMIGKFLKVSYDDFMANFMPQWDDEPDFRNAFSGVRTFVNPRIEEDLYQPFVRPTYPSLDSRAHELMPIRSIV